MATSPFQEFDFDKDDEGYYGKRYEFMANQYRSWWQSWFFTCFDNLVPYRKWKFTHRNVQVGDIVQIKFERKVGQHGYRYGRVTKANPDSDGNVRTCDVAVLPRDKRHKPLPYVNKGMLIMTVPIQRLCMVTPVDQLTQRPTVAGEIIPSSHSRDQSQPGGTVIPQETPFYPVSISADS